MAESNEASRQTVASVEAVRALFARLPDPNRDLVWLTDELIGIAQYLGTFSLELIRDDLDHSTLVCRADSDSPPVPIPGRGPSHLFRPLLARLAVVGAEETGTDLNPYGGRCVLARSSRSGPVSLEIEFVNTTELQRLSMTRKPLTRSCPNVTPPVASSVDPTTQPAG
jgi:hypothetical protein